MNYNHPSRRLLRPDGIKAVLFVIISTGGKGFEIYAESRKGTDYTFIYKEQNIILKSQQKLM